MISSESPRIRFSERTEDETSYFDDAEQFFALQKEALVELVKHHQAKAAWVEVTGEYNVPDWRYRKASRKEPKVVLINLSPSGRVEIREGLAKTEIEKETAEALAENPAAPPKAKAAYSTPLCRLIAHHKTLAEACSPKYTPHCNQYTSRITNTFRLTIRSNFT